jgi:phosphopantetheine adenylyltransferase/dephospho-CoA kinase
LEPLSLVVSPTIEDTSSSSKDKVSSTSIRRRQLGKWISDRNPYMNTSTHNHPVYVIGLTGGIGSGKSSIAKRLGALGANVIDCDLLGHRVYQPSNPAYQKLLDAFHTPHHPIVSAVGQPIERRKLGAIVFGKPDEVTLP